MTTIDKFLISFAAASIFVICLNVLLYVLIGRYVPIRHISVSSCRLLNDNVTFDIAVSEQSVLSKGQLWMKHFDKKGILVYKVISKTRLIQKEKTDNRLSVSVSLSELKAKGISEIYYGTGKGKILIYKI